MPNMNDLNVRVEADIKGFDENLKRAGGSLNSFERKANSSLAQVDQIFQRAQNTVLKFSAAYLSIKSTAVTIQGALQSVTAISDIASRLDIGTDSLQEFQFAAINTGTNVDTMNRALETLTKRVGEAQAGQGELVDVARQYNISLVDNAGQARSVVSIYGDLANAVEGAVSPQERLRIAAAAFGGTADELLPLLSKGSQGFRDFGEEARNSGVIIDKEIIDKAAELDQAWNNAMLRLKASTFNTIFEMSQKFNEFYDQIIQFQQSIGRFNPPQEGVTRYSKEQLARASGKSDLEIAAENSSPDLDAASKIFQGNNTSPPKKNNATPNGVENFPKSGGGSSSSRNRTQETLDDLGYRLDALKETNREQDINNALRRAGVKAESAEGEAIAQTAGRLYDATEATKQQRDALDEARRASDEFGRSVGGALNDIIVRGGNAREVLSGLFAQFGQNLFSKASDSIFDKLDFGSFFSGGGGSGWADDAYSLSGFAEGGIMTPKGPANFRRYSEGGIASTPQLAMFGEGSRAEAFVPLSGGRHIPVEMRGGGGGTQVTQNINISTGVEQTVRAEMMRMMPALQRNAVAGVESARNRGITK